MAKKEVLNELSELVRDVLERGGMDTDASQRLADSVVINIKERFQGEYIYIKKGDHEKIAERNEEIYKLFTGHNHGELGRLYGLSAKAIYAIIKAEMAKKPKLKQVNLFDEIGV